MLENVLAAQLYSVRQSTQTLADIAETFKKISDIGYTAVQISGFGPVDPAEVGKLVSDAGLTVAATHVNWDRFVNETDAVIEEHKLWSCRHAALGGLALEYHSLEGLKRFLDELGPVAEKLAAEGLDLSYHNHAHELIKYGEKTWLEMLYEQADPKHLKAEIDTYWIQAGGGDPAAWVARCKRRMPIVHLKDMIYCEDRTQRFAEIGQGNMNWTSILAACKDAGVEWYAVEQDDCYGRDPFECLAVSYHNLKKMGLS